MRFSPLSLILPVSALAYSIQPGLAVSTQPACNLVTFYYNDVVELASATSVFFGSGSAFCESTATANFAAATSSAAPPPPPGSPGNPNLIINGGFEDTTGVPWVAHFQIQVVTPTIISGTVENPAHSGTE
ncbi:hypothetical protein G7Y89_g11746 [Cudoniella acicularis]|uniref:Uncharacterized protein n=1 Tax=Cudoniella acicularis TaxID=354080 RepID=A0A8H4VXK8_9HELO|nr:hypothetical protein G7Y89_g11746 [Cudoniella acicularis]